MKNWPKLVVALKRRARQVTLQDTLSSGIGPWRRDVAVKRKYLAFPADAFGAMIDEALREAGLFDPEPQTPADLSSAKNDQVRQSSKADDRQEAPDSPPPRKKVPVPPWLERALRGMGFKRVEIVQVELPSTLTDQDEMILAALRQLGK